jgi:hypothetical protein
MVSAGVGKSRCLSVNQPELAMQAQLFYRNMDQLSAGEFTFHADLGQERDPVSHGYELLDGLQRGQLDVHVERGFKALERLDYFVAIGRGNVMRGKGFGAQLADADFGLGGKRMAGRHDEHQLILIDHGGMQLRVFRIVGQNPQFRIVP